MEFIRNDTANNVLEHDGYGKENETMKRLTEVHTKLLDSGKAKRIGVIEKIPLVFAGYIDGLRGLPRQNEDGEWTSAVLNKELHSYKEYCDAVWGKLQIDVAEEYSRLGFLVDAAKHLEKHLDEARKRLEKAINETPLSVGERKSGEERLSADQVRNRRVREYNKQIAPFRSSISSLESQINENITEATAIKNMIIEANNATRMICEKVKDHIRQRMDVYWNAALAKHPYGEHIPVIPDLRMIPEAELVYYWQHKPFLEEMEEKITYLSFKYDVTTEGRERA